MKYDVKKQTKFKNIRLGEKFYPIGCELVPKSKREMEWTKIPLNGFSGIFPIRHNAICDDKTTVFVSDEDNVQRVEEEQK